MGETALKLGFAGILLILVFAGRDSGHTQEKQISLVPPAAPPAVSSPLLASALEGSAPIIPAIMKREERVLTQSPAPQLPQPTYEPGGGTTALPPPPPPPARLPAISANATIFLIADIQKEEDIAHAENARRWPIASLTKLMTAVIALESIPRNGLIEMSTSSVMTEGLAGGFTPGELISAEDLVKSLMVVSSNDAAMALANQHGFDGFVARMNAKAGDLGMKNTFFKEPTGLSPLNQSTAADLKLLARYILANHPDIFAYSREKETAIRERRGGTVRILRNINHFSGRDDFAGGKTGYTLESGENLLSLFSRAGRTFIIIVMDAAERFKETASVLSKFDTFYR